MPERKRRPRALTEVERHVLEQYLSGRYDVYTLKLTMLHMDMMAYRKYNNYLRWRKRELRRPR